jgi:hypothetical protein
MLHDKREVIKMTKVNFFRKAHKDDLIPKNEVKIEKVVTLQINEFRKFEDRLLDNYDFITENKELMYIDEDGVWHAILITAKEVDYGIVVQSEGYDYARYAAYISKSGMEE